MIPYSEFQLTEKQIHKIKHRNQKLGIAKYIREHGFEPEDTCQFYTATEEQLEDYRRAVYATYKAKENNCGGNSGNQNQENNSSESGNTNTSGQTIDSGNTNQIVSDQFILTLAETPCVVGNSDIAENAISLIRNGILNGDLLDYTSSNIVLNGDSGTITITDLTKTYYIPQGEYEISGWIGRPFSYTFGIPVDHNDEHALFERAYVLVSGTVVVNDTKEQKIPITMVLQDSIVLSNSAFSCFWRSSTASTVYGVDNTSASTYDNCYYMFADNEYKYISASWDTSIKTRTMYQATISLEQVQYQLNSFEKGKVYFYGIGN